MLRLHWNRSDVLAEAIFVDEHKFIAMNFHCCRAALSSQDVSGSREGSDKRASASKMFTEQVRLSVSDW